MNYFNAMVDNTLDKVAETVKNWKDEAQNNHTVLVQGTVLDPVNHPSYDKSRVASVEKARKAYNRSIKAAQTRYDKAVAL